MDWNALVANVLTILALAVTAWPPMASHAQEPQPAQVRVSRADLFIASFGPSGETHALRTSELEMREQVRLAFYGMDATRVDVERGRLTQAEADLIIDGFEQTVRNYIHDHSNETNVLASLGRASDIPAISRSMGAMLAVGRQDALIGREELAAEAQQKMVQALRTFSQQFADTCDQQTYAVEVPLALERQNQVLGTGIDLTHCMRRRMEATIDYTRVKYEWSVCSIDGSGDWALKISGFLRGEGRADEVVIDDDRRGARVWYGKTVVVGPTIRGRYDGVEDDWRGRFEIRMDGPPSKPAPLLNAPNDAGPNARPNNWPKAPVPDVPIKTAVKVGVLRMETIQIVGDGYYPTLYWTEAPIRLVEKPCRSASG